MKEITLDRLPKRHWGIVTDVKGSGARRGRLLDLGILPQTPICLVKTAPFGDPIQIVLRGYTLTLRRSEARTIIVSPQMIPQKETVSKQKNHRAKI